MFWFQETVNRDFVKESTTLKRDLIHLYYQTVNTLTGSGMYLMIKRNLQAMKEQPLDMHKTTLVRRQRKLQRRQENAMRKKK